MKRLIQIFLFITVSALVTLSYAAGPASVYQVKVKKFELWNGTTWITAFEGTSTSLDIAATTSGQSAGVFLSGLIVPDGVYTQVRVTPHPSFVIKGNDGAGRYTTAANGVNGGCTSTNDPALEAECTITLTGGNEPTAVTQNFSATPITVTDGVPDKKIRVSFDVSAAVNYNVLAGEIFPDVPNVSMSMQ